MLIADALEPVNKPWILSRTSTYLNAYVPGGAAGTRVFTDRNEWHLATGVHEPSDVWGAIDRARGVDYQDDPRRGTPDDPWLFFIDIPPTGRRRGIVEAIIAHEACHLRFKTLGHSKRFYHWVQDSLYEQSHTPPPAEHVTVRAVMTAAGLTEPNTPRRPDRH